MSTGTSTDIQARLHHTLEPASFFVELNTSLQEDHQILFLITTPPKEGVVVSEDGFTIEIKDGFIERSKHKPYPITGFKTKCGTTFSPPRKSVKKIRTSKGEILNIED